MYNIEYDLKLDENGLPYIEIPENSEVRIEHRFFNMAMVEYMLTMSFELTKHGFDEKTANEMVNVLKWITEVKLSLGDIVLEQMEIMGDVEFAISKNYHFKVNNLNELENLYDKFIYDGKLFHKKNDLIGLVNDLDYYKYTDGEWLLINKNNTNETN